LPFAAFHGNQSSLELRRRNAKHSAERPGELKLIGKVESFGCLLDQNTLRAQKVGGVSHTVTEQILVRTNVVETLK
jgi:hypothetical protein